MRIEWLRGRKKHEHQVWKYGSKLVERLYLVISINNFVFFVFTIAAVIAVDVIVVVENKRRADKIRWGAEETTLRERCNAREQLCCRCSGLLLCIFFSFTERKCYNWQSDDFFTFFFIYFCTKIQQLCFWFLSLSLALRSRFQFHTIVHWWRRLNADAVWFDLISVVFA